MLKKSSSVVLAGHCRLTISAAFTSLPRFIQRGVNLRGSTYRRAWAAEKQLGVGRVRKDTPRPLRHGARTGSRPSEDVTLIMLRVADLAVALLKGLLNILPFMLPAGLIRLRSRGSAPVHGPTRVPPE
jgi:hypothetical protein